MLGGRRRCSEKEACKHGVLFSLLSLAPASVYSKKLWNRNLISKTWCNTLESRVTEMGLEKSSEVPIVYLPAQNMFTSGMLPLEILGWKLPPIQMLHSVAFVNVFVKSNSNCQCCNIGLSGFPSLVWDSQVLLPPLCRLSVQIHQCCVLGRTGCCRPSPGSGWKNADCPSRVFQKLWIN